MSSPSDKSSPSIKRSSSRKKNRGQNLKEWRERMKESTDGKDPAMKTDSNDSEEVVENAPIDASVQSGSNGAENIANPVFIKEEVIESPEESTNETSQQQGMPNLTSGASKKEPKVSGNSSKSKEDELKKKCHNYICSLLNVAKQKCPFFLPMVEQLVQHIIDDYLPPSVLLESLKLIIPVPSSPDGHAILEEGLPYLRQAMIRGEITIEGIYTPRPTMLKPNFFAEAKLSGPDFASELAQCNETGVNLYDVLRQGKALEKIFEAKRKEEEELARQGLFNNGVSHVTNKVSSNASSQQCSTSRLPSFKESSSMPIIQGLITPQALHKKQESNEPNLFQKYPLMFPHQMTSTPQAMPIKQKSSQGSCSPNEFFTLRIPCGHVPNVNLCPDCYSYVNKVYNPEVIQVILETKK